MNILSQQTKLIYCRCRHVSQLQICLSNPHPSATPHRNHQPSRSLSTIQLKKYMDILDVNKNSTPKEIKDSFLKLSKVYHPDNKTTGSHKKFVELKEAYDAMKDGAPAPDVSSYYSSPRSYTTPEDRDRTHRTYAEARARSRAYYTAYERGESPYGFGGPYANSSNPWEEIKREKAFRRMKMERERFGTRAFVGVTLVMSGIAWIVIYSGALLIWDYNNEVKKGLRRYHARTYEDYKQYEAYLQKRAEVRRMNLDRRAEPSSDNQQVKSYKFPNTTTNTSTTTNTTNLSEPPRPPLATPPVGVTETLDPPPLRP